MKKYKVTLGNPCTFGWQNMTTVEKGRHCSQCDKTVVDFTVMTDEEVIQYLLSHKNVCGHFNKSQLGRTMLLHEPKKKNIFHWPSIAAMLVAGMFQLIPSNLNAAKSQGALKPISEMQFVHGADQTTSSSQKFMDKDSLITLKIKVVDASTKKIIYNANVALENIGSYKTNKKGEFSLSTQLGDLPEIIKIQATALSYHTIMINVDVKEFVKNPYYQLELWYDDPYQPVDGGDIYIEQD